MRHWPSAGVDVAVHRLDLRAVGTRHDHQLVMDGKEVLADDVEVGARQQVVDVGHPARYGIVDGDHRKRRLAFGHGLEGVFESAAGHGLVGRVGFDAGDMRIGTGFALVGDLQGHQVFLSMRRAVSSSLGVSTPSGTVSTRTTTNRMPSSRARICSSLRSSSRALTGSDTKRSSAGRL